MAIVAIQRYVGDPAELREQYLRSNAILRGRGPADGVLAHLSFETETGLCVVNVWRSVADQQRAAEQADFRAALQEAGMPYVEPVIHQLLRLSLHAT